MGWCFYHREVGQSDLEHFRQELLGTTGPEGAVNDVGTVRHRLIDGESRRNAVFYGALEITENDSPPYVTALICLIHRAGRSPGHNFGYKDLSEDMGVGQVDCPERILALLTPVELCHFGEIGTQAARQWRTACWEHINDTKNEKEVACPM